MEQKNVYSEKNKDNIHPHLLQKTVMAFTTTPTSFIYRMALDSFVCALGSSAKPAA